MAYVAIPLKTQTSGIAVPTGAYDATDLLRVADIDPNFHYLNKGNVFYKLLQMLGGSEAVDQPRHEYFTDDKFSTVVTPSTDYSDSATTVVISESNAVVARTVLYNTTTSEAMYVTAVSGASLTVVRGHQGTTAAAITAATDVLVVLETSLPEGADAGTGIAKLPTKDYAVVSFYSEGLSGTDVQELTNMLNNAGQMPGQMVDYQNKILEQIDNSIRWSKRDIDTSTSSEGTLYYTGGFNTSVTTNNINLVGTLAWADFNDNFASIYDNTESSQTKYFVVGPTLFDKINTIAWGHFVDGDATPTFLEQLGARMTSILLENGGVMKLIRDPYGFSTAKKIAHKGFLIDPAHIGLIHFNGFDMVWRDVTAAESHTKKSEVFGSAGLKTVREETHARVYWTAS